MTGSSLLTADPGTVHDRGDLLHSQREICGAGERADIRRAERVRISDRYFSAAVAGAVYGGGAVRADVACTGCVDPGEAAVRMADVDGVCVSAGRGGDVGDYGDAVSSGDKVLSLNWKLIRF